LDAAAPGGPEPEEYGGSEEAEGAEGLDIGAGIVGDAGSRAEEAEAGGGDEAEGNAEELPAVGSRLIRS